MGTYFTAVTPSILETLCLLPFWQSVLMVFDTVNMAQMGELENEPPGWVAGHTTPGTVVPIERYRDVVKVLVQDVPPYRQVLYNPKLHAGQIKCFVLRSSSAQHPAPQS
jgi:hypothetical protein